jgi:hypothetical protein
MPEMNDGASGLAASTHNNPITDIKVLYISYNTDHRILRNKRDNWKNPATATEQDWIANSKPEYRRGENGDKAQPVSHSWEHPVGMWVYIKVEPPDADPEVGKLIGESGRAELSFKSPEWLFVGGEEWVPVYANAPLPKKIDLIEDFAVHWKAATDVKTHSPCGESKHEIYVTAGKPMLASSWPMTSNNGQNHNWVTAFRMKHAAKTAKDQSKGHDIVKKIWAS